MKTVAIQDDRYIVEAECLNCDWVHFYTRKVGGHNGNRPVHDHVRNKGHKVKLSRTHVVKPLGTDEVQTKAGAKA